MIVEGETEVAAVPEQVWPFLLDPERVASCVPGLQDVRRLDERTFAGVIAAAVGPIDGRFAFRAAITRADFPSELDAEVDGTDDVTHSRVTTRLAVALTASAPERTRIRYRATVSTEGRLAILGDMILRATANLMVARFTRCLAAVFEPAGEPTLGAGGSGSGTGA